jgi:2-keto-4-pentenoate hydratase/2-oxohepta-3-ene-1,7-dioic acid hydratase in catechol pathway
MKLGTIDLDGRPQAAAILAGGAALPLAAAARAAGHGALADALEAGGLQALIEAGPAALAVLRGLAANAPTATVAAPRLLAPIPRPRKNVFCVGRNYAEHIAEGERAQNIKVGVSEQPVYFTKPPTAVIGPDATAPIFPSVSTKIDYEVELALIIGQGGVNIPRERAMEHVFGYAICNDITARDVQRRHGGQFFKGKGLDGSCPFGPWIVTADEIADPHALGLRLWVNDEKRQDGNTKDMIFDIPTLIASLSEGLTLEPGDILATGTPSGVGYAMEPPRWLADGDVVTCEIDGIGRLVTTMRSADAAAQVA